MADVFTLFTVFLFLFLFGMTLLRIGLHQFSYRHMKRLIMNFVDKPWKGMLIGIIATALLQSSSGTMILTVSLVGAGVLTFQQSIGIILGANIGTTLTLELFSFFSHIPLWPILIIGTILLWFPSPLLFGIGTITFGLGTIFVALDGFSTLALPLQQFPLLLETVHYTNEEPLVSIIIGTVLTMIIQSSTASTGIAMAFLQEGVFTLPAAIGIMLGANIGTCITAWVASLGSNHDAKLAAFAHIWLNIAGVVIFAPFLDQLAHVSTFLASTPAQQLAHISVLFNIVSSLMILPIIHHFTTFVLFLHDKKTHAPPSI
ncbi:Na/Pi symporter [Pontibacillus litoralis]|uniref:Na/Pi cotransporter n=1 Tax=Pontibacillus litoralis JSM 072002 TaxID=1385512 RepID=A0A0A5G710_9BACI|nr:Na/Pi symporter [Pontibacillus litoralis]KGX88921.1 Na/Pi cotransporter [Pontibacillus litoralis JSM 072002]